MLGILDECWQLASEEGCANLHPSSIWGSVSDFCYHLILNFFKFALYGRFTVSFISLFIVKLN